MDRPLEPLPKLLAADFVKASYEACQHDFHGRYDLATLHVNAAKLAREKAKAQGLAFNSLFARECLLQMNELDLSDDSHYRAFDAMDEILGLDYSLDDEMKTNLTERLYEGGGVGVQTSYSSLLTTLRTLKLKPKSTFIDLGSGFGRVGFTLGLLRPDIEFIGYEYVDHRTEMSRRVSKTMGFDNVEFITQDLSARDFTIPFADVYYMFDPFHAETYGYVLGQLIAIGKIRETMIVTKGRANAWTSKTLEDSGWNFSPITDLGAIVSFNSPRIA